jgi:1-acyl-sn-glycerol-3-phosphate acyltransferase
LLVLGWGFAAVVLTAAFLFAVATLRVGVRRYSHRIARLVGRTMLALQGIELVVEHAERLADRRPRIVLLNHTSQLDLFIFAALFPPGGSAVGKKEILWVPLIGWCFWAFGFYTIDRENLERAKALLWSVGEDLKRRRMSVFIAPEGTRARDLRLQPFKKGAFHLAAVTHVPIVPAIVRGAGACQPYGQLVADPGVVGVELLPPSRSFTRSSRAGSKGAGRAPLRRPRTDLGTGDLRGATPRDLCVLRDRAGTQGRSPRACLCDPRRCRMRSPEVPARLVGLWWDFGTKSTVWSASAEP